VSLVLADDQVVFGFGAVEEEADDIGGYAGWVMAYNESNLAQSGVFATVTTGTLGGGVWQSGRPPVVDSSGYVYVFVGNGYTSGYDGVNNFNESVLKLNPSTGLSLIDWFTPDNWSEMDAQDLDLTSSGPMLIPGTSLLAGGGKTGILHVLNTANLGKETATDSGVVQEETIAGDAQHQRRQWSRDANCGAQRHGCGVDLHGVAEVRSVWQSTDECSECTQVCDGDQHRHVGAADHEHHALEQRLSAVLPEQ
jgi:hypothetical protein